MYEITASGPETPDPSQLELFDTVPITFAPVNNSTDADKGDKSNEPLIRSPTPDDSDQPVNGKKFDLNEAQTLLASSLHRKSRELVFNSLTQKQHESIQQPIESATDDYTPGFSERPDESKPGNIPS